MTNEGPGARFDHSAIAVGENQIIVFGGRSNWFQFAYKSNSSKQAIHKPAQRMGESTYTTSPRTLGSAISRCQSVLIPLRRKRFRSSQQYRGNRICHGQDTLHIIIFGGNGGTCVQLRPVREIGQQQPVKCVYLWRTYSNCDPCC